MNLVTSLQHFPGRRQLTDGEFVITLAGDAIPGLARRLPLGDAMEAYAAFGYKDVGQIPLVMHIFVGRLQLVPATAITCGIAGLVLGDCKVPGHAVMWAYSLYRLHEELGRPVTMLDFMRCFRSELPDAQAYKACWEAQKQGSSNRLDTAEAWQPVKAHEGMS